MSCLGGGALRLQYACGGPAEGGAGGVDEDAWHGALVAGVFVGPGVGGDGANDQDPVALAQAVGDVLPITSGDRRDLTGTDHERG